MKSEEMRDARPDRAQGPDGRLVLEHGVAALHRREDAVGARLHREMHVRDELVDARMAVDEPRRELARVRGGEADALDAGDLGQVLEKDREVRPFHACSRSVSAVHAPAIGVHVLAEEGDLLHALQAQVGDLGQHVVEAPRDLLAARIRHDAEAAVLAAAFHDGDECRRTLDPRRRQAIELLDLGKRHVDLRPAGAPALGEQLGQAMERLWSEHEVDVGRAGDDRAAFLARDAAADADHEAGPRALEVLHPSEIGEHLLLRLLAHRAGVEEDEVGVFGLLATLVAVGCGEHVGHPVRVVLVHLASEGADVDALRHRAAWPAGLSCSSRRVAPRGAPASRRSAAGAPDRIAAAPPRSACPVRPPAGICPDARPPRR